MRAQSISISRNIEIIKEKEGVCPIHRRANYSFKSIAPSARSLAHPILGGFHSFVLFTCATRCLPTALTRSLHGRTRDVSIGAEYAAVTRLGLEYRFASFTIIEILAGVRRHCLGFLM